MITGIYRIVSPSGKVYIGKSRNIIKRWNQYKRLDKRCIGVKVHNSLKKYGIENHQFEIVVELSNHVDELTLSELEDYFFQLYFNAGTVLNSRRPILAFETRKNTTVISKETREKISNKLKGRPHSKERSVNIIKGIKNKYPNGRRCWNKGKTGVYSEETLNKIRSARAKQIFSDESKIKKLNSFRETIAKRTA